MRPKSGSMDQNFFISYEISEIVWAVTAIFFVILGSQIKYCVLLAVGTHNFVQQTGTTASASGEILRGRIGKGWEKSLFQHKKFDPIFDSDGRQSVDILFKSRKMSKTNISLALILSKNKRNFLPDSGVASKMGQIQKIKSHYILYKSWAID